MSDVLNLCAAIAAAIVGLGILTVGLYDAARCERDRRQRERAAPGRAVTAVPDMPAACVDCGSEDEPLWYGHNRWICRFCEELACIRDTRRTA